MFFFKIILALTFPTCFISHFFSFCFFFPKIIFFFFHFFSFFVFFFQNYFCRFYFLILSWLRI
jgi:hypothetical protein